MHKFRSTKYITHVTQLTQRNTKYTKWYTNICTRALNRGTIRRIVNSEMGYVELHHIVPRCIEPKFAKERDNMVFLSAREHFVCHYLLCKMFSGTQYYFGLIGAFGKMSNSSPSMSGNRYINSRLFELFRKSVSEMMKSIRKNKIRIKKNDVTKEIPAEHLNDYISQGWSKGAAATIQATQARVAANRRRGGYIWVKRDEECKQIRNEELLQYQIDGWHKGRLFSNQGRNNMLEGIKRKRNRKSMFKNNVTKFIDSNAIHLYLKDGWQLGRAYVQIYTQRVGPSPLIGQMWYHDDLRNYREFPDVAAKKGLQPGRIKQSLRRCILKVSRCHGETN